MSEDTISRQQAIDEIARWIGYLDDDMIGRIQLGLKRLPSAQPERLTDDDFETIRIHLNAYKEKLCNQQRWKEADEYQRILDRFISFASAQPVAKDINVPVKDCISRKAAIDAIMDADVCVTWNGVISDDDAVDIAIKSTKGSVISSIVNMPSAQPDMSEYSDKLWRNAYERGRAEAQPRWIPCSERLPKKERRTYWVCTDAETQHECRWTNNRFGMTVSDEWGWNVFDTPQYTKVIAWMPLPEPYAERRTDDCV